MKRSLSFNDVITGNFRPHPKRKIRLRITNKPPDKIYRISHQNQLSKTNQTTFNTFAQFVNIEFITNYISIYELLLLDLMKLKPSFFGEKWNGAFIAEHLFGQYPQEKQVPSDALRSRITSLIKDMFIIFALVHWVLK